MKSKSSFRLLFIPFLLLSLLSFALFVERAGLSYNLRYSDIGFLEPISEPLPGQFLNVAAESLVLYDSEGVEGISQYETVVDVLNSMRVRFNSLDVANSSEIYFDEFETVVIAFTNLNRIQSSILELSDWAESGGRVLFAIRPDPSLTFSSIYRKLGILSKNDNITSVDGIHFLSDLMPGANGINLGLDLFHHSSIPVQLEKEANVHLISADDYGLPLLWDYNFGRGRYVVINSDQFNNKNSRGIVSAAYSLLKDVSIFPVINSSIFFIDDFPSPIPQGENQRISKEFGRDIESFFTNIWWPDMRSLARKYGIRYTGALVETFNDLIAPPFDIKFTFKTFNYFGSTLLMDGGEIALKGYNNIPLCLEDIDMKKNEKYPTWQLEDNMRFAIDELIVFSKSLFPDQSLFTYVPPSNILCEQTRSWLPQAIPELKVISSIYFSDPTNPGYVQEFSVASDGIIELPRISSGYDIDDYMQWITINELFLHYIHSHYVNSGYILSEDNEKDQGWIYSRNKIDDYLLWLYSSAPNIRNMTASDGAKAVQRFYRLDVDIQEIDNSYIINIGNFYDEAFFLMRSPVAPVSIEGGKFSVISDNLFLIEARNPKLVINFEMIPDIIDC